MPPLGVARILRHLALPCRVLVIGPDVITDQGLRQVA